MKFGLIVNGLTTDLQISTKLRIVLYEGGGGAYYRDN